jgi:type VI secretion system secreted protein VgrG
MALTQANKFIALGTPLGKDVLIVRNALCTEHISRLFQIELDLISTEGTVPFEDIIGQGVTLRMKVGKDQDRYFNGVVNRFVQTKNDGNFAHYRATLVPWLWLLTRTSDCRIFQKKSIPDIIEEVFKCHGLDNYTLSLSGSYQPWDYCVQYRETDFNFVSRLMEQEGIYYFFVHENGKHTLVLADAPAAHCPNPGYETVIYRPPTDNQPCDRECVTDWVVEKELQSGVYALKDFNFESPRTNLFAKYSMERTHAANALEVYDYPGEYEEHPDGESYAQVRLEELQAAYETCQAQATVRGLCPGFLFTLQDHPREDQNREYLVTSVSCHMDAGDFESGAKSAAEFFTCSFTAMDCQTPFRPARTTPKPLIQGPQTAMVVGPSGQEIYTDEYGRVKVQFHWDRYGKSDENSSCWVRVSQAWAGKGWGSIHIPRIGQEVIVEFLEGDPDRPIITGRVYNAESTVPYGLPDNKTQSGIKSHSSMKGGDGNFNEFRFEDKKGSEQIYLHGEKDWTIDIKNCENETVGSSISTSAGGNISRNAGGNISRTADDNVTDKAGKDITTESGKNMCLKAGGSYSLLTNLGIHLKAMNFVAMLIESGAKDAAAAVKKGATKTGATAVAAEGASGGGKEAAVAGLQNTGMQGLAALSPGIEAGAAALTAMSAETTQNLTGVESDAGAAAASYQALNKALEAGASPEVVAAAFMGMADAVSKTVDAAKKVIEGLFPQIPNIELWAMKDINAHALWSMSLSTKVRSISIEAQNKDVNVKGKQNVCVEAEKKDINIKASKKNVVITGKEAVNITAEDKDIVVEAKKKKVFVKSAKQIFLKCGSASISMADSGNIVIKGAKININGSGPVQVKGTPIKLN